MNVILQALLSIVLGVGGMIVGAAIVGGTFLWLAGNDINNVHNLTPLIVALSYLIGGAAGLIGGFKLREHIARAIGSRRRSEVRDV